jgi:hypothetical protein
MRHEKQLKSGQGWEWIKNILLAREKQPVPAGSALIRHGCFEARRFIVPFHPAGALPY